MRNISLLHCFADDAHQPLTNSFLRHIQRPFAPPTLVCSHNDANLSLQKGTVEMAFLYYATKRIRCTSTHTYVFLHLPKPKFPQLHSHWRSWDVFCLKLHSNQISSTFKETHFDISLYSDLGHGTIAIKVQNVTNFATCTQY